MKSSEDKKEAASAAASEMAPFRRFSKKPYKVCAIMEGRIWVPLAIFKSLLLKLLW